MTTACPSEDDLVRLVEGALADASLASIEQHVDGCETCAAVVAELGAMRPAAARLVGRYQLDRRIAAGGMGEVWAAWDPTLRRDIAIKLVRPDRADDGKERDRLLREARALARLQHPNVLAVYDVGLADGDVFLATELVAGDTLANRGGASGDWRALARLYAQAARGLAAAHAAGLVHRDVKPANLLLGADGRVRVADFGLAVRSATPSPGLPEGSIADPQITASGLIAGTPAYMAPEQRLGSPADARADQFALCLALVEGIDGRRPPADMRPSELVAFVAARRIVDPALEALCIVLARGLSGLSEERHADMTALADAIERCAGDTSGEASIVPRRDTPTTLLGIPPPSSSPSTDRRNASTERSAPAPASTTSTRSRKPVVALGAVAALAVAGFAAWKLVLAPSTDIAVTERPTTVATAPSTTAPSATAPSTTAPSTTAPSTTAPSTTAPSTTGPSTTAPSTTTPSTTAPSTTAPSSHVPTATAPAAIATAHPPSPNPSRTSHPPSPVAPAQGGMTPPASQPPSPPAPSSPSTVGTVSIDAAMEELGAALKHRDARRCRDIVDAIDPNQLEHAQANSFEMMHARCEMIGGDCAGGSRRVGALYQRLTAASAVATAVQLEADLFCPLTGDAATVKRRLLAQTSRMSMDASTCRIYLAPARQLASVAATDLDKRVAASVLVSIAKCLSVAHQCTDAHALLKEADPLAPGVDNPSELTSACQ